MKRTLLMVLVLFMTIFSLYADAPETGLFAAADQVATDAPRAISNEGELLLGGITYNGLFISLGDLFADLSANRLTSRQDFAAEVIKAHQNPAYPPGKATWILSGSLYQTGTKYILTLQLIENSTGTQIKGWDFSLSDADIEGLLIPSVMAGAADWDAYEPNNSVAEATLVTLPFSADNLVLASGDEDWFAFEAPESTDESVYIFSVATYGDTDTYLELYSPEDTSWAIAEDDDTDGSNAAIQMPLNVPGTWYLKVRAYDGEASGDYGLSMEINEGELGPGEPDGNAESAHQLNVGQTPLEFSINYTGDEDWYRIVLTRNLGSDEVLRIETFSDYDTVLVLMDEYEGVIVEDDDSGYESNAMIQSGNLSAGTYYVAVRSFGGETFSYSILANITVPVRDAYEDDSSISMYSEIGVDDRQERNFSPMGDDDWVRFSISEAGRYIVLTEGPIDTYMELYEANGNLVTENDDFDDTNAAIEQYFEVGDYFVRVSPYGSASPDDMYTLILEAIQ